jgi:hypothetical protein
MATVHFDVIPGNINAAGTHNLAETMNKNESLSCIFVNILFLLASPYRLKGLSNVLKLFPKIHVTVSFF